MTAAAGLCAKARRLWWPGVAGYHSSTGRRGAGKQSVLLRAAGHAGKGSEDPDFPLLGSGGGEEEIYRGGVRWLSSHRGEDSQP